MHARRTYVGGCVVASAGVTVSLNYPTNGLVFQGSQFYVFLSATASASQGYTVSKVEFF